MDVIDHSLRHRVARLLGRFFIVTSLGAVVLIHLSFLPLRAQVIGHWWGNLTGQDQRWVQFAADPRAISIDLWAELTYEDGEQAIWTIRSKSPFADMAYYHWVKWAEAVVLESHPDQIEALAGWLKRSSLRPVASIRVVAWTRGGFAPGEVPPEPQLRVLFSTSALGHARAVTFL